MKAAKVFNMFYGTPAKVIADCCLVSLNTAYQWKRGDREPGSQSRRLFLLHRHGRVLGDDWEGWSINGGVLIDPEGNKTTQGQLRAYAQVYQLCSALKQENAEARVVLDRLGREASSWQRRVGT